MNSSGSAMKNVAQCSCGRSAVKVNWPWRLSMSTQPAGGQRRGGPGSRAAVPAAPPGAASVRAPATPSLSARRPERHPIPPRGTSSDRPLATAIWASSSLPGDRAAPTAPPPAARTHAERGGRAAPPPAPASGWRRRRGVQKGPGPLLAAAGRED